MILQIDSPLECFSTGLTFLLRGRGSELRGWLLRARRGSELRGWLLRARQGNSQLFSVAQIKNYKTVLTYGNINKFL